MKTDPGNPTKTPLSDQPLWRRILNWPSTRLGRWSGGFLLGFLAFFGSFQILVASGQRGGATFFSNPWLAWTMLTAAVSALVAGAMAFAAILWKREKSFISFFALLLGLLVAFVIYAEIAFPH